MNICITNHDMQPQFICGIKRVISILSKEWTKECNITIISVAPEGTRYQMFGKVSQYIFPDIDNILSKENETFFSNVIRQEKIDIVLHPYALEKELTQLCVNVRKKHELKLITALHFAPTHNSDILRSFFFNTYRIKGNWVSVAKEVALYIKYLLYTKHKIEKEETFLIKSLIANSDKLIFLSVSYINSIKNKISNTDLQKVAAINNPANIYNNKTEAVTKKKQVLWCGRVEYSVKRVDRIIDIWREIAPKYPDWELIVMGSGDIEYFRNLTKKLQIPNITFTGSCDPTKYYEQGAILCMTSSTEGLPMVLIEAMQYRCATIAYNSFESLQDIITDGYNGYTVTPFNKNEYIQKLKNLMTNDAQRKEFGQNGMEVIKKFDKKVIADKWIELFREIIAKK